jgi:hypothetical protein
MPPSVKPTMDNMKENQTDRIAESKLDSDKQSNPDPTACLSSTGKQGTLYILWETMLRRK